MIVLPQQETMGTKIGKSLGTGLENALNQWSQLKLNKIMQRQNQSRFAQAFEGLGIPAEKAAKLALFSESSQKELIKAIREHVPLAELFQQRESQQQGLPENEFNLLQNMQPSEQVRNAQNMEVLREILSPTTTNPMDNLVRAQLGITSHNPLDRNIYGQEPQEAIDTRSAQYGQPSNTQANIKMAPKTYKPRTIAEAKQYAEQRKADKLEQVAIDKEYQPMVKEIRDKYKGALEDNRSLDRMERLIETKNLSRPRFASLIGALKHGIGGYIGLDLTSMLTPESQEFEKLSQGFLKGAKNIFGSRITDNDLNAFMKTIPNLSQSREGKRRIIYNMRLFNEATIAKKKAADEILNENNGHVPRNFEGLIESRAKDQLDNIAERFNAGYQKPKKEHHKLKDTFLGMEIPHPVEGGLNLLLGKG